MTAAIVIIINTNAVTFAVAIAVMTSVINGSRYDFRSLKNFYFYSFIAARISVIVASRKCLIAI